MKLTRRTVLSLTAGAAGFGLAGTIPTFAADGDMHNVNDLMQVDGLADRPEGPADAAVTVIEYASPTCPHCAQFHNEVYPEFKEQYIETGKVQFLLRPFMRNVLDAVVFMLAEAAGEDAYHGVIETYFANHSTWAYSDAPRDAMLDVALQLGFTEESFEAALTNQDLYVALEAVREQAIEKFDLTGTPTFYINGKQLSGEQSIEELAAEIDPLLA